MSVIVTWNGRRFEVGFHEEADRAARAGDRSRDGWARQVTLGTLLEKCAKGSRVPVENIKLLHGGDDAGTKDMGQKGKPGSWWDGIMSTVGSFAHGGLMDDDAMDDGDWTGPFAIMKDPRASLADYGVRTGSKIMMIGDNSPIPQRPAHSHQPQHQRDHRDHVPQRNHENLHRPAPASNHQQSRYSPSSPSPSSPHHSNSPTPQPQLSEEEQLVEKLNTHLEYARNTVLPVVDDYVNQVKAFIAAKPESSSENSGQPKPLRDLYAKCSELLLQCLLKIDSVICPPELEGARTTRKEAVRFVQSKLDEIDSLKEKANASL